MLKNCVRISTLLLCACLLLTGCDLLPRAREMGDMALLRAMGVDRDGDGVAVTVSTGPRARGLQGEREPALELSAQADSLSAACLEIQGKSDEYVFFGYVDQLLLGEELARKNVLPALEYLAQDVELGLNAQVWVVRGKTAGEAVGSGGEEGVDGRLSTLRTDGKMGVSLIPRTAGEVYAGLLELGCAYAPAVALGDGEDISLEEAGYAVLKGESLAGFLDGDAARGLELLAEQPKLSAEEFSLDAGRAVVKITGARTEYHLIQQNWAPEALELTCRVEAELAEHTGALSEADRAKLEAALSDRAEGWINAALAALKSWSADCVGLGGGTDWQKRFGEMKAVPRVEVSVRE